MLNFYKIIYHIILFVPLYFIGMLEECEINHILRNVRFAHEIFQERSSRYQTVRKNLDMI